MEGRIYEAYLTEEIAQFCQYYFASNVPSQSNRVGRNMDWYEKPSEPTLSIFNQPGRPSGKCVSRYLTDKELTVATLYVLLNCDEVQPYLNLFIDQVRQTTPNITDQDVEKMIEDHFAMWFSTYVHNSSITENEVHLYDLARGPLRRVKTWPIYFVNGYKFHTKLWSEGKKTINCGVAVRGTGNVNSGEDDFYGILNEVIELKYTGPNDKKLVLFCCDWFDPVMNRGWKVHPQYGIVEIKHTRRYAKYDPFIFAQQAIQVYYAPYPVRARDKMDWWVVIKTKPRGLVDRSHQLESAYQDEEMRYVNEVIEDDPIDTLCDINGGFEEIEIYVDLSCQIPNEGSEVGDDEDDDEESFRDDDDEDDGEDECEDDSEDGGEDDNHDDDGNNDNDEDEDDASNNSDNDIYISE